MTPTAQKASCCAPADHDTVRQREQWCRVRQTKPEIPYCGYGPGIPTNAKGSRGGTMANTLYFCCVGL